MWWKRISQKNKKGKDNKKRKGEGRIIYTVIAFTAFCLVVSTAIQTFLPFWFPPPPELPKGIQQLSQDALNLYQNILQSQKDALQVHKDTLQWTREVLKDGFFLGLGAILAVFRSYFSTPEEGEGLSEEKMMEKLVQKLPANLRQMVEEELKKKPPEAKNQPTNT